MLSTQSTFDLPPGAPDADPRLSSSAAAARPPPPQSAPPARRQPARQPHLGPEPIGRGLDDETMMQLAHATTFDEANRRSNMDDEKLMTELEDEALARRMQMQEVRRARRERGEPDEKGDFNAPPESPRPQYEARTERQPARRGVVEQLREANARGGVVTDYFAEEAEPGLHGRLAGEPGRTGPVPNPRPPARPAPSPDARPPEDRSGLEREPETLRHVPERPQVVNVSGNDVDDIERHIGGLALTERDAYLAPRREAPKPKSPPHSPPRPATGPLRRTPSGRDVAPSPPPLIAPPERTHSRNELPPGPSARAPTASAADAGAEEENEDSAQFAERISRILARSEAPPARGHEEWHGACVCECGGSAHPDPET